MHSLLAPKYVEHQGSKPFDHWTMFSVHKDSSCRTEPEHHQLYRVSSWFQTTHRSPRSIPSKHKHQGED